MGVAVGERAGRNEKLEIRNEKLGILGEGASCEVCDEQ